LTLPPLCPVNKLTASYKAHNRPVRIFLLVLSKTLHDSPGNISPSPPHSLFLFSPLQCSLRVGLLNLSATILLRCAVTTPAQDLTLSATAAVPRVFYLCLAIFPFFHPFEANASPSRHEDFCGRPGLPFLPLRIATFSCSHVFFTQRSFNNGLLLLHPYLRFHKLTVPCPDSPCSFLLCRKRLRPHTPHERGIILLPSPRNTRSAPLPFGGSAALN